MTDPETFSVFIGFPDGATLREAGGIEAEAAVRLARRITLRPAVKAGLVAAVFITDAGDNTVFLWEPDRGVVFPT